MTRWGAVLTCLLAVHCATSEDEPDRKKPGGYDDAGSDAGGTGGGSGGSGGSGGGTGGSAGSEAGTDGGDAAADAAEDAAPDGPADAAADADAAGPSGRLLLVARSASDVTFGESTGGAWTTQSVSRATLSAPAIAATAWGAVVVVRDQSGNALSFSTWSPGGSWSSFAAVAAGGATIGSPALAAPGDVHLAFLGTNYNFYSNVYTQAGGWQASFTNVEAGSVPSFGPSAPALAVSGTGVTLAHEGNDHDLYTQDWQSGWQPAFGHGLTTPVKSGTPPASSQRPTTGKVVVAYVEETSNRLMWTEGSGTSWSTPVAVHSLAYSPSTPAVAGLPNGNVVLAYRAQDDKVYATLLTGSSFGAPVLVHPSLTTGASPAVAPGVGGHIAELAWVSGGSVQHSSLGGSGWSGPTAVAASGQQAVALATQLP